MKIIPAFLLKDICALSFLSDAEVPGRHLVHAKFRSVLPASGAKALVRARPNAVLLTLLWAIIAMNARPAPAQAPSTAIAKSATGTPSASHHTAPGMRTLAQTMKFIETTTPVNKPLLATMHYPSGQVSYMATVSAFATKNCSTDSTLRVNWGSVLLDREPHVDLGTIDPHKVEIITSDAYRTHIVHSQGGEDVVSVTSPVDYFIGIPEEIGLQNGNTTEDLQIFAITEDKTIAEGLAKAYIFAIAACGHKPGAAGTGPRSAGSSSVHEIERQSLMALEAQEKEAEAETTRDAETYATQAKVAQEKAAAEKAAREAAMAQVERTFQAVQAERAEEHRQWQAKVDDLTEQVRIAEQDALAKEQIAGQADQLQQQAGNLTDVSAANSGSMGTAGVLVGALGNLWGSHTAKKNRNAAQKARAHANELRAQLDAMGASQPPPVTDSRLPPMTVADTSNPIQDALNKGLSNINAAYAQDMALKAQQAAQRQSISAADTKDAGGQTADDVAQHCKGHHPDPGVRCGAALGDGAAWAAHCYCP
jgi:hypothetical protein